MKRRTVWVVTSGEYDGAAVIAAATSKASAEFFIRSRWADGAPWVVEGESADHFSVSDDDAIFYSAHRVELYGPD